LRALIERKAPWRAEVLVFLKGIRASNRSYNGVAGSRQRYIWSASRQTDQSNAARRRAAKLDFVEKDLEAIRAGWGLKAMGLLDVGSNAAQ